MQSDCCASQNRGSGREGGERIKLIEKKMELRTERAKAESEHDGEYKNNTKLIEENGEWRERGRTGE